MTKRQRINKISELEQWLMDNPNHANRTVIETDLRKLKEEVTPKTVNNGDHKLRDV